MNPKKILLIGSVGMLMSCTYSPTNTRTINNYYDGTGNNNHPQTQPENEMQIVARVSTIQELERLNKEFDQAIDALK